MHSGLQFGTLITPVPVHSANFICEALVAGIGTLTPAFVIRPRPEVLTPVTGVLEADPDIGPYFVGLGGLPHNDNPNHFPTLNATLTRCL